MTATVVPCELTIVLETMRAVVAVVLQHGPFIVDRSIDDEEEEEPSLVT